MARVIGWLIFALLLPAVWGAAQPVMFPSPLSPRLANYSIAVTLNDSAMTLAGREILTWRNSSGDVVPDLRFHLYLNAFRNSRSTFMSERGSLRGMEMPPGGWGSIDITSITLAGGEDLTQRIEFIHPDSGSADDQTVARVALSRPLPPGATVAVAVNFTAHLPKIIARTGYAGEFIMAGQWFPKLGVWESVGDRGATRAGWNCHEFHPNTEFFADFGVYDVAITLPERYVVGATGVRWSEKKNGDGTKTLSYHAEDVHDFAWTASPKYVEVTSRWRHVTITALMQPDHVGQAQRYIGAATGTLEHFDRLVGPYPYPVLTIVDPSFDGFGAGGMEYPTLITAGTLWALPDGILFPELVTEHEFGHQYWYGMSASNEFEEAWLDEGINQYYEGRIMNSLYGEKTSFVDLFGIRVGDFEFTRSGYADLSNPRIAPPATFAWKFPAGSYSAITYSKTAVVLQTLEGMIGTATMDSAMRTFFRRWKFRHPTGRDFVNVFNEIVPAMHGRKFGPGLDWFFDQTLFGTSLCDYRIADITTRRDSTNYRSVVRVERMGDLTLPVDVLVSFEDGTVEQGVWDGKGSTTEFTFLRPSRVRWAKVDPGGKIALDLNQNNNSLTRDPSSVPFWKYFSKALFWLQNLIQNFTLFS